MYAAIHSKDERKLHSEGKEPWVNTFEPGWSISCELAMHLGGPPEGPLWHIRGEGMMFAGPEYSIRRELKLQLGPRDIDALLSLLLREGLLSMSSTSWETIEPERPA
jgi:hypothetical protein